LTIPVLLFFETKYTCFAMLVAKVKTPPPSLSKIALLFRKAKQVKMQQARNGYEQIASVLFLVQFWVSTNTIVERAQHVPGFEPIRTQHVHSRSGPLFFCWVGCSARAPAAWPSWSLPTSAIQQLKRSARLPSPRSPPTGEQDVGWSPWEETGGSAAARIA